MITTTLSKDRDGRTKAASQEERNGILWDIHTSKGYRGISCSAYRINSVKKSGAMIATSYSLLEPGHSLDLAKSDERATEAAIMRVHQAGLARFEAMDSAGELPHADKAIEPGQVLFFDGSDGESREYVYKVDGEYIYTVLEDGSQLNKHEVWAVKPIEKKFGIGTYYRAGEVKPLEEVNQLVNDARAASEDRKEKRAKAAEAQAQATEAARVRGAEIVTEIPAGMKAVIIGELHRNTSDMMTDYFAHDTEKVIYLAFSATDRDDFKEMRRAATKAEETRHLSDGPTEYEHREKYSMGAGYYLKDGHSDADGWAVEKASMPTLEKLQIAAGEGRYFANIADQAAQTISEDPAPVVAGTVQIIDYSAKAIAVIGDTKPIKDKLKALGGRFNFRLTCGAGWIFRKCDLERVRAALTFSSPEEIKVLQEGGPETRPAPTVTQLEVIPTAEEVEAVEPVEEPEGITAGTTKTSADGFFRESSIITTPGERRRAAKVTPQVPAPWSQHGAKVSPQSAEAVQIVQEVSEVMHEAKSGRIKCADGAEQAAAKIDRIDTPEAAKVAATLRTIAKNHRAELAKVQQQINAQASLFEQAETPQPPAALVQYANKFQGRVQFVTVPRS